MDWFILVILFIAALLVVFGLVELALAFRVEGNSRLAKLVRIQMIVVAIAGVAVGAVIAAVALEVMPK